MADTAKNVQEVEGEEARCPQEGHTAREEQGTGQVEENDENCCTVEQDCEELSASQEQKRQAMVISDLASPTVSVISISSDEEDNAQRHSMGE